MPLQSLSISLGPLGFEARLHMLTWETSIPSLLFFLRALHPTHWIQRWITRTPRHSACHGEARLAIVPTARVPELLQHGRNAR